MLLPLAMSGASISVRLEAVKYHAHIYFDESSVSQAESFRQKHLKSQNDLDLWVGPLVNQKVGPHPTFMFEVHLTSTHLGAYREFIKKENPALSILLHEDTGDDLKDHTTGATWFGKPLELDFTFFDLIQTDPSRKIHKD
jgi:aromatic ring-cleaving dioxygenase